MKRFMKFDWATVQWERNVEGKYSHKQDLTALFYNGFRYFEMKKEIVTKEIIDNEIYEFRKHFPLKNRVDGVPYFDDLMEMLKPPSKKNTRITFRTVLSDIQLQALFKALIKEGFISPETSYKPFKAIFSGIDISAIQSKINWEGANNLLAYFIDELKKKRLIKIPVNHWDIAKHCFDKAETLRHAKDRYENSKTGHPKQAPVIDIILEKVYNSLQ